MINLPEETHDAGFAMTSSFSTMLLTALVLFDAPSDFPGRTAALAEQLRAIMRDHPAASMPQRAVYLGAGPLALAAREAALKVMGLSAGQIPALWDSTLGFRHGPKFFATDDTAITLFQSPDHPASTYETDLAGEQLCAQFPQARTATVGPTGDTKVAMPYGALWAAPLVIATAQLDAVRWSHALGLNVDDPFVGQDTLSRVVSGVKLNSVAL